MRVIGSRLIVKEEKNSNKTTAGIVVKGKDKEPTYRGEVIAVGNGALLENGTRVPMEVNVGDKILYAAFSGSPISVDGTEYIILNERDLLCILD